MARRVILALGMCLQTLSFPPEPDAAPSLLDIFQPLDQGANTEHIVTGLKDFALRLGDLASLDASRNPIPLTMLSPGHETALQLRTLFQERLGNRLNNSYDSLDNLREAIEGLDSTQNGLAVTFDNVAMAPNRDDAKLIDISFAVTATREVKPALSYFGDGVNLTGGSIQTDLKLNANFRFQLDTRPDPPELYLVEEKEPTLLVGAVANATVPPFVTQIGFITTTVTGNVKLDVGVSVAFKDPDGNGRITSEEWTHTAFLDLYQFGYRDNSGAHAVDARFDLDSDLIPGVPDGTISIVDQSLATDGFNPTSAPNLGHLSRFQNITADDVLSGLAVFTTGLLGSQYATDLRLPFLKHRLSDSLKFAQPLSDFVRRQGDADIVCGTQNTIPPSGVLTSPQAGDKIYCQAFSLGDSTGVQWTVVNGASTVDIGAADGGTVTTTVALNPTSLVTITLTGTGKPEITLTFTDTKKVKHSVVPRFETAQELLPKLLDLGGFDRNQTAMRYDPTTESLTYRLVKRAADIPVANTRFDFGDMLKEKTGLLGLTSTGAVTPTVSVRNAQLDVTFGVLLADGSADPENRFFIQAGDGPSSRPMPRSSLTWN